MMSHHIAYRKKKEKIEWNVKFSSPVFAAFRRREWNGKDV
jgi:hypothetical protein